MTEKRRAHRDHRQRSMRMEKRMLFLAAVWLVLVLVLVLSFWCLCRHVGLVQSSYPSSAAATTHRGRWHLAVAGRVRIIIPHAVIIVVVIVVSVFALMACGNVASGSKAKA